MTDSPPLFTGEPFERLVALLIAIVAVLAAVTAFLEADAGSRSDRALRDAQQYGLQAVGARTRGEVEIGYALTDAYRLWLELDSQAFIAQEDATAGRYTEIRDVIASLSPLLQPPYFDGSELPDINAYEADRYLVRSTQLSEQYANAAAVAEAWDGKAQRYVTHLTLLTVTLFLYGLSTTITERIGFWFVGTGTAIATFTLLWVIAVVLEPVPVLPDDAINAYAKGVGLRHQDRYADAVAAFDEAVALSPTYANAYYDRARANFQLGRYQQAAADYLAAIEHGRSDVSVPWNLGWTLYIGGELEPAAEQTIAALALAPQQIALHFNRGLIALAAGDTETAQRAYDAGAELAVDQVTAARRAGAEPPATLWWYLGQAAADLDNLERCLESQRCSDAPPFEAVERVVGTVESERQALEEQLKSLTIALEYDLPLPNGPMNATIDNFGFAEAIYDEQGAISGYQPLFSDVALRGAGTFEDEGELADVTLARTQEDAPAEIFIAFDYDEIGAGQLVVAKVYANGREIPGLRLIEAWQLADSGEALLPLTGGSAFSLVPGEYRVELYVDAQLAAAGGFTIAAP